MVRTAHPIAPSRPQLGLLGWLALVACLAVQAESEWSLAVTLGWPPIVAGGIPAALGAYAVRALHAGREILLCVAAMVATVAASRLVHAGMLSVTPYLVIAVSAVPALVMWRIHALGRHTADAAPSPVGISPSSLPVVIHVPSSAAAYPPPRPTVPPAIEQAPAEDEPTPVDVDALRAAPIPTDLGRAERVVARLYRDLGHQPITSEIADALKKARLSYRGGTPRDVRTRAKAGDPTLKLYPPHPSQRRRLAAV
jgi:hypothetical protein